MEMQSNLTRKLVLSALFAALICVVTMFAKWPIPGTEGYIHAGDGFIYTAAVVMGGPWAAAAAGIGSMLADLLSGYFVYAPATLVIKALMALLVGLSFGRKSGIPLCLVLMTAASVLMIAGYAVFDFFVYGTAMMIQNALFGIIQGVAGVAIGLPLALLVKRIVPESWAAAIKK